MKLLHTADWQLGLRLNFVGGDTAARLRSQRYDTIREIARVAHDEAVDLVVVAGDVFDDNRVGRDTLQQARDAIGAFGDIPLVLLPGNHDAATPDSALARLPDLPPSVIVPLTPSVREVAGVELLLCPLCERHVQGDPTAWIEPAAGDARKIRVAVAHGGVLDFSESAESVNRIRIPELLAKGVDYVALGDWHGLYPVDARAGYSGAHEATRFREQNTGNVLLVEIDAPGAEPHVVPVPVGRTRWLRESVELTEDADVDRLLERLRGLEEKSWTLLRLELTGELSLAARDALDAGLADLGASLAHLRLRLDGLRTAPTAEDLEALTQEGYLGRVIARLREDDSEAAQDGLRVLYRLLRQSEEALGGSSAGGT